MIFISEIGLNYNSKIENCEELIKQSKIAGADIIGIGMDAATEEIFYNTRGKGAKGPHDWDYHWEEDFEVISESR